ncbi:MAG: hypothetical protein ACREBG_14890 [Pyrinomonadaceae bacterium]
MKSFTQLSAASGVLSIGFLGPFAEGDIIDYVLAEAWSLDAGNGSLSFLAGLFVDPDLALNAAEFRNGRMFFSRGTGGSGFFTRDSVQLHAPTITAAVGTNLTRFPVHAIVPEGYCWLGFMAFPVNVAYVLVAGFDGYPKNGRAWKVIA